MKTRFDYYQSIRRTQPDLFLYAEAAASNAPRAEADG